MNLTRKKQLAAKTLKVGKNRIHFNEDNLNEIKEAITKQDIRELYAEGIITIKPVKGRKKIKKRKTRRGPGKIKKKVNKRKQIYVKITRKLRTYLKELKGKGVVDRELFWKLRKKIRMRDFRSKAHFKEYLVNTEKISVKPEELIAKKSDYKSKKKTEKSKTKKPKTKVKTTKK